MDRRRFLATTFAGAAAALLAACNRAVESLTSTPTTPSAPGTTTATRPATTVPATAAPETTQPPSDPPATTVAAPTIIEVISRAGWGADEPRGGFTEHTIDQITVHHTARVLGDNRQAPAHIRSHQRFHQIERGWPDIAYHFLIDAAGNVYEGRPVTAVGDTGTNYDPTGHFLIACEGDFDSQEIPAAQLGALEKVVGWALGEFGLGGSPTINGHRDVAATSCPGDFLYPLIADGTLVEGALQTGPVELQVLGDEVSGRRVAAIEA